MPEEMEKAIREMPRTAEVIALLKKFPTKWLIVFENRIDQCQNLSRYSDFGCRRALAPTNSTI
jgi:hypothetical protein